MNDDPDPWVEVVRSSTNSKSVWQALFAAHINIRPYEERLKLKWGFSAAFLHEEALDRQKLFIESQGLFNPIEKQFDQRMLGLRCIVVPSMGLLLSLVGKVYSGSQEAAVQAAIMYWREIKSIFPYDYVLSPITAQADYQQLSGRQIISQCGRQNSLAQIRRFESTLRTSKGVIPLLGLWQTNIRSDEQIWRALACSSKQVLLSILLKPEALLEEERHVLWGVRRSIQSADGLLHNLSPAQMYDEWADALVSQRKLPWNRFYIIQVHLAAPEGVDEYLLRAIGSAVTRDSVDQSSAGFEVVIPSGQAEVEQWCSDLALLEVFPSKNNTTLARLNDVADLNEAHSVFRFPYPPETELPGTHFLERA